MAEAFGVAGSAVGVISLGIQATQYLFDYYTAVKDLESNAADTTKRLGGLLELLQILHDQMKNPKFLDESASLRARIAALVENCVEYIEDLQDKVKKFQEKPADDILSKARAAGRVLAYPFRQNTLRNLEAGIDGLLTHLSLAQNLMLQKDLARVKDDLGDMKAVLDLVRAGQVSDNIHKWLQAPDPSINFNAACAKKHPSTGLWLLEDASFKLWLTQPNSLLWLNGFAGCGKSVLCSTAIQHTYRYQISKPRRVGIAFFFFTFSDERKQDISSMLRSLVLQLSGQLKSYALLSSLHGSYQNSTPPDQAFLACLRQLIRGFDDAYIFLDALDESPRDKHRSAMLEALAEMREWSEPGLHLLVTSRDEIDIREELRAQPNESIDMRNKNVDTDIANFISQSLRQKRGLRKWEQHYSRIEAVLTERAKGVFRWVECQFTALASCPRSEDLLDQLLYSLPDTLDETYRRMLANIPSHAKAYAQRMLMLLCYAKRPLEVTELICGIAVELGATPRFNPKRRLMDEVALQEVCPGFTELQSIPGPVTIRIAHFSLQEYLESDRIKQHKDVEFFGIVKEDAHNQIASICLTICLQPKLNWVEGQSDLLRYSSTHWPDHFKDGGNKQSIEIQALKLFQDLEPPSRAHLGHPPSDYLNAPLHYLAFHNLHSILSKILSEKSLSCTSTTDKKRLARSLNKFSAWKETPLATASEEGHMEVVQLLVEKGADIDARHPRTDIYCLPLTSFRARNRKMLRPCQSALEGASQGGHIGIVQFLLERGADTSPHHSRVDSVIQYASAKGHEEIIRLLVEHGADVNCRSGARGSAIQQASCGGHLSIVKFLLEHGADVNCRAGARGSAIQQASLEGHVSVVKFLLEHGADINCQAGVGRSAIHQASFRGHRSVVKFLLEHGAAFNEPGEQGTALQAAASQGRTGVVKLLLKKGADINLQALSTRVPKTALIAATVSMCAKTVKFLLDNGADMEIQDEIHGTALQVILRAWQRWINNWQGLLPQSIEIFKQLVEKGANTQAALQSASPEVRDLMLRFSGAKVSHGGAE